MNGHKVTHPMECFALETYHARRAEDRGPQPPFAGATTADTRDDKLANEWQVFGNNDPGTNFGGLAQVCGSGDGLDLVHCDQPFQGTDTIRGTRRSNGKCGGATAHERGA